MPKSNISRVTRKYIQSILAILAVFSIGLLVTGCTPPTTGQAYEGDESTASDELNESTGTNELSNTNELSESTEPGSTDDDSSSDQDVAPIKMAGIWVLDKTHLRKFFLDSLRKEIGDVPREAMKKFDDKLKRSKAMLEFYGDGTYTGDITLAQSNGANSQEEKGTWEFEESDDGVQLMVMTPEGKKPNKYEFVLVDSTTVDLISEVYTSRGLQKTTLRIRKVR